MWSLLSVVAEEERRDLRRYLHRALEVWSKQGKLTQPLVRIVCSHTANKQHEKVSRAFWGGICSILELYMYLPSPLYNIQYVHVCTMHVHTYYMYIHIQYVSTVHVLHMYRLCGCQAYLWLCTQFFCLVGFPQQYHVYRVYSNPCTQVMVCRID